MKIQEYRSDLIDQFVNPYNSLDDSKNALEKILWLLHNPSGTCQKCEYAGGFWDCECNKCTYEDEDIINEPCGNLSFCICDYFDGEPTQEQIVRILKGLRFNELTNLEKEILTMRKSIICDIITAILTAVFDTNNTFDLIESEREELSHCNDPFELNKEILKYSNKKLSENDRIKIINVIFLILEHYSDPNEKKLHFIKIFKFFKYLFAQNKQTYVSILSKINPLPLSIKTLGQNLLKYPEYLDNDDITFLEEAIKEK